MDGQFLCQLVDVPVLWTFIQKENSNQLLQEHQVQNRWPQLCLYHQLWSWFATSNHLKTAPGYLYVETLKLLLQNSLTIITFHHIKCIFCVDALVCLPIERWADWLWCSRRPRCTCPGPSSTAPSCTGPGDSLCTPPGRCCSRRCPSPTSPGVRGAQRWEIERRRHKTATKLNAFGLKRRAKRHILTNCASISIKVLQRLFSHLNSDFV